MVTFEQVLELAKQLPPVDQARLQVALQSPAEAQRATQISRNRAAIAMLDSWSTADEHDDGNETWEEMLAHLDQHRESARLLYPQLRSDTAE